MAFDKLEAHLLCGFPRKLGGLDAGTKAGIVEDHYPAELRNHLFENFHALGGEVGAWMVDTREPPPRPRETIHESNNDRIGPGAEDDRDLCRRPPCCYGAVGGRCIDQVDLLSFEIPRSLLRHLRVALPISDCEYELFSLCKPLLFKSDPEPVNDLVPCLAWDKDADAICFCLLRLH